MPARFAPGSMPIVDIYRGNAVLCPVNPHESRELDIIRIVRRVDLERSDGGRGLSCKYAGYRGA